MSCPPGLTQALPSATTSSSSPSSASVAASSPADPPPITVKVKQVHFAKPRSNADKPKNGKRGSAGNHGGSGSGSSSSSNGGNGSGGNGSGNGGGRGTRSRRAAAAQAAKDWKPTLSPVCEQKQMLDREEQQQQQRLRRSRSVDRAAERRVVSPDRRQRLRAAVLSPDRRTGGGTGGAGEKHYGHFDSGGLNTGASGSSTSSADNAAGLNDKEKLKQFVAKAMQQQTRTAFHKALDTDTSDDDGGDD